MGYDKYVSPLSERYASKEMQYIFSPDMKFKTWRKLWIALAETEKELGLNITDEQIAELKEHAEDINYDVAKAREKVVRHDVMSHVYAYGQQCPKAKGIIHLGATSCYVGDNTDIIIMAEALKLVKKKLVNVLDELSKFADQYKDLPTLAFTHFQPAQPTTVGKRATLWMQEFSMDLADLDYVLGSLKLLGSKGTTGVICILPACRTLTAICVSLTCCSFAFSKFLLFCNNIRGIHTLTVLVGITSGLNTPDHSDLRTLMQILFCKLCPSAKCDTVNKVRCLLIALFLIPAIHSKCISSNCRLVLPGCITDLRISRQTTDQYYFIQALTFFLFRLPRLIP